MSACPGDTVAVLYAASRAALRGGSPRVDDLDGLRTVICAVLIYYSSNTSALWFQHFYTLIRVLTRRAAGNHVTSLSSYVCHPCPSAI